MEKAPTITVIGGINLDISGTADSKILLGDSNPGEVRTTLGGVGRNIAECLARLGARVTLLTCLGDDSHTPFIRRHCAEAGIDLADSPVIPGSRTNTYLCINDVDGDVFAAVADMGLCDRITPAFAAERLERLNASDLVVADANLPADTLTWLGEYVRAPIAADPVSVKKAERLRGCLPHLAMLKPNRPEAELLSGRPIRGVDGLERAAEALRGEGVERVFISLGAGGVYFDDGARRGIQPCLPGAVKNTNGCGDAFLAGACIAALRGLPVKEQALWGQAASSINAESERGVSPELSLPAVQKRIDISRSAQGAPDQKGL